MIFKKIIPLMLISVSMPNSPLLAVEAENVLHRPPINRKIWLRKGGDNQVSEYVEFCLGSHDLSCGFKGLGYKGRIDGIQAILDALNDSKIQKYVANNMNESKDYIYMNDLFPQLSDLDINNQKIFFNNRDNQIQYLHYLKNNRIELEFIPDANKKAGVRMLIHALAYLKKINLYIYEPDASNERYIKCINSYQVAQPKEKRHLFFNGLGFNRLVLKNKTSELENAAKNEEKYVSTLNAQTVEDPQVNVLNNISENLPLSDSYEITYTSFQGTPTSETESDTSEDELNIGVKRERIEDISEAMHPAEKNQAIDGGDDKPQKKVAIRSRFPLKKQSISSKKHSKALSGLNGARELFREVKQNASRKGSKEYDHIHAKALNDILKISLQDPEQQRERDTIIIELYLMTDILSPNIKCNLERALDLSLKLNDTHFICKTAICLGNNRINSVENLTQALRISKIIGNKFFECQALIGLGQNKIDPVENFTQALTISREIEDKTFECQAFIGLGNARVDRVYSFQKALDLAVQIKHEKYQLQALLGLSRSFTYGDNRDLEVAYNYAQWALKTANTLGDNNIRNQINTVISHMKEKHEKDSFKMFKRI